jgi:phage host-nuclease inhibitor protein Gam
VVTVAVLAMSTAGCGDSARAITDDRNEVMADLSDVLEDVQDQRSAEKAKPKIQALVKELKALDERMGDYVTKHGDEAFDEFMAMDGGTEEARARSHMLRVMMDPATGPVLMDALSELGDG